MWNCSYVVRKYWLWRGLRRVIRLSIVPYSCSLSSIVVHMLTGLLFLMYLMCSW